MWPSVDLNWEQCDTPILFVKQCWKAAVLIAFKAFVQRAWLVMKRKNLDSVTFG